MSGHESQYHRVDGDDWDQEIDLSKTIEDGSISIFEVSQLDISGFKNRFDKNYFCDLDNGEAESLAFLTNQKSADFKISSGDAIVFKVLGNLNIGDQGISLEEVLQQIGLSRRISEHQYTKAFRDHMTHLGSTDRIQGRGLMIPSHQTYAPTGQAGLGAKTPTSLPRG